MVQLGALFVEELAQHFELEKLDDCQLYHGRLHWEPSPRLAIALQPRK